MYPSIGKKKRYKIYYFEEKKERKWFTVLALDKYPKWSSHDTIKNQTMEQTCELHAEIFCPYCNSTLPLNL